MEANTCAFLWNTEKRIADNVAFMGFHSSDFGKTMCEELDTGTHLVMVEDNVGTGLMKPPCTHCRRLRIGGVSAWEVFHAQKSTIVLYQRNKQIYRVFPNGFAIPDCGRYTLQQSQFRQTVRELADLTASNKSERATDKYDEHKGYSWCSRDDLLGSDETSPVEDCRRKCSQLPGCTGFVTAMHTWDQLPRCSLKSTEPAIMKAGLTVEDTATTHIRRFVIEDNRVASEEKYDAPVGGFPSQVSSSIATSCVVVFILAFSSITIVRWLRTRVFLPLEQEVSN